MTTLKRLFLTCMVMTTCIIVQAQCPTKLVYDSNIPAHADLSTIMLLDIKTDFCAVGNGTTNDQAAFEAASVFIKKRGGYCKLTIPNGVYRVGRQIPGKEGWYQYPGDVLKVEAVRHVEIAGVGNAKLQYMDGLKYGFFDPLTDLPINGTYLSTDTLRPYVAAIGDMIRVSNAEDITIHDLILDGNLYPGKMNIGGHDPVPEKFTGIQEAYSGIGIYFARGVNIDQVTTRRFGLDGILVLDVKHTDTFPKTGRVFISNLKSDFNGRQGASFVWGDSIFVSNSSFTNTGMGEITYSGLQGGIDIEPEESNTVAEQFFFDNCIFDNNRNGNIIISSGQGLVQNVYFKNCKSYNIGQVGNTAPVDSRSFNGVALDIGRHINLNFTDCEFYGYVHLSKNQATSEAEGYKFKRCLFSDCYQKPVSWTITSGQTSLEVCALVRQHIANISTPLVFAPNSAPGNRWEYVMIDSSIFDVYDRRPWVAINATYDKLSWIKNSTIYVNNESVPGSGIGMTALSDNFVIIDNNKIFLYDSHSYIHDGVTIAGPGSGTANWGSIQFNRWYSTSYTPNVCEDTVLVNCPAWTPFSSNMAPIGKGAAYSSPAYQVYPNPAVENRFVLKNLSSQPLYYEFLGVNGSRIAQAQLNGYTSKEFNFPGLSAGIYYLKVVQDKTVKVEKIVLKR